MCSVELSNTLETGFCLAALDAAFVFGQPEVWNSDQGSQFTSADFLAPPAPRPFSFGAVDENPLYIRFQSDDDL